MNPLVRIVIEAGPLAAFFLLNARGEDIVDSLEGTETLVFLQENGLDKPIFLATAGFMVVTLVALAVSYAIERRLPIMPMVSGVFVLGFGTLTLLLQDEDFIKLKPTITNSLFAVILFGGLAFGRPLLRPLFGSVMELSDRGWRTLTLRWACFFVVLAVLNEIVWRSFDTDTWVDFKVFGIMPLTLVFAMTQIPLLKREAPVADAPEGGS
ncbi:MAG: septation protein A [Alphaproteobacteria bacterium]